MNVLLTITLKESGVPKSSKKSLRNLEACASVDNNLCEKLVLSLESPITFDQRFKVTLVPLFIPDFNVLRTR